MPNPNSLNIIVIDDDREILDSFKAIFENTGFQLSVADSGKSAIEQFSRQHFHIAFIDLYMPDMDGLDTMIRLKEINSELIAVMISGFRNEDMLERALKAGAYDYLYKPLDVQDIFGIT
ncbi:MAG: response regulator, partial [bacterium]